MSEISLLENKLDNDILVLISMLPGIESAIESLTKERDMILGRLGMKNGKRKYTKKDHVKAQESVIVEPVKEVRLDKRGRRIPERKKSKLKCPICGKILATPQGMSAHKRTQHPEGK